MQRSNRPAGGRVNWPVCNTQESIEHFDSILIPIVRLESIRWRVEKERKKEGEEAEEEKNPEEGPKCP